MGNSALTLTRHVQELLLKHEIDVVSVFDIWRNPHRAPPRGLFGLVDERVIGILPIVDEVSYFTALHEIGHVVLDHRALCHYPVRYVLRMEAEAWLWAIDHAHGAATRRVCAFIRLCYGSYQEAVVVGNEHYFPRPYGSGSKAARRLSRLLLQYEKA